MAIRYTWHAEKERSNRRKHGVSFTLATRALNDPFAVVVQDRIEAGEMRWRTTGMIPNGKRLIVAHTIEDMQDGDEVVRIISARTATRLERRRYEERRRRYL
jgi:uncharacterized protein